MNPLFKPQLSSKEVHTSGDPWTEERNLFLPYNYYSGTFNGQISEFVNPLSFFPKQCHLLSILSRQETRWRGPKKKKGGKSNRED